MTRDTPPTNLSHLQRLLTEMAKRTDVTAGRIQRHLAVVVVGQMLNVLPDVAAIKGATNLELRLGTYATRASSDLDAVLRGQRDAFEEQLRERLREGWNGFTGVLTDGKPIAAPVTEHYKPWRYAIKLQYCSKPFTTLAFELAAQEIDSLAEPELVEATEAQGWLADLGFPAPDPVRVLPLSHQIAQKLHACTAPDVDDHHNERVHDLVDLQLAHDTYGPVDPPLAEICRRLFTSRGGHAWPPQVTARADWDTRYPPLAAGLAVADGLADALAEVNKLIAAIDAAR